MKVSLKLTNLWFFILSLLCFCCQSKQTQIESTSIAIKQIQEIGELTTAEYYGEVVSSLEESMHNQQKEALKRGYQAIRNNYISLASVYKKSKSRVQFFKKTKYYHSKSYQLLRQLTKIDQPKKLLEEVISKHSWTSFREKYSKQIEAYLDKAPKSELVYLGRGWVKAGFNLADLKSSQFKIKNDTLFIHEFKPQIFDTDINPWFIPEESKGFELVRLHKGSKISFEQINAVKYQCKQKLKADAIKRGIYANASKAAEEMLMQFFEVVYGDEVGFRAITIQQ